MSDKIIKVEGVIEPAGDFVERVEDAIVTPEQQKKFSEALAERLAARKGVALRKPTRARPWTMMLGPEEHPGDSRQIVLQGMPRCYFRTERLRFGGELDGILMVLALVGRKMQMSGDAPIVCANFVDQPLDWELMFGRRFDTVQPALMLAFGFINTSGQPRKFDVAADGIAIVD